MPQSFAVSYSNHGGATQIQVYQNNNGTLTALGNPYTPASLPSDATGIAQTNLAVQFGEYFYCSAGNEIRRYNPSTGNWDLEVAAYAFASLNSSSLLVGRGPTGTPRLAVVYRGGSVSVRTLDISGGAWAAAVATGLAVQASTWPVNPPITFNNEYLISMRGEVVSWSFDGSGSNKQTVGGAGYIAQPAPHSFTRVGTRLFALTANDSAAGTFMDIWERIGGTWALALSGITNQTMPRLGGTGTISPNGCMFYDDAADSLVVIVHLDSNTAGTPGTPGVGLTNTNPGGNGLHAVRIPISMIGKATIGPDGGTGFAFTGTTITRNDGGSWLTDGVEIGSVLRIATAEDAGNNEAWGPVTGATATLVTVATFFLREHNITGAIIIGGLQAPSGVDPLTDSRFAVEVDTDTDPLNPIQYIWACPNNTAQQRYQYNGVATPLTVLGTGGNRGIALSHNPNGGGGYFLDPSTTGTPTFHIEEVQARVPIVNGTRIFLRGYQIDQTGGIPTPTDEMVGLYWSKAGPTCNNLATISNAVKVSGPGSVPGVTANKITGFTFDETTIISVDWNAVGDGVLNQQQHMLMPLVEV